MHAKYSFWSLDNFNRAKRKWMYICRRPFDRAIIHYLDDRTIPTMQHCIHVPLKLSKKKISCLNF